MKYTLFKEADKKIEKDMQEIIKEIRRKIPEVISIFLTGGFSRGEGPVKKVREGFYPYNDYDIQVITQKKLSKEETDNISIEISKKLGYRGIGYFYNFKKEEQKFKENFYIDLKVDTPKDLETLLPRIRTIELKENSKLLWGKDVRSIIPNYQLKEIPLAEGAKLLLDRMSQLIQYYSLKKEMDKEFMTYIIQQAYAACCTSLLLLSKKYEIGYLKSMKIFKENYKTDFPELYKKSPNLDKKIEEFIKWKSNPEKLPNRNIDEEWFIVKDNILEVTKYFFSKFLNKKINTLEELSNGILGMREQFYLPFLNAIIKNKLKINLGKINILLLPLVSLILKYKYYQRLKKFKMNKINIFLEKSPELIIFGSLIFLIGSIDKNGVNEDLLKKGRELLGKVYNCKAKNWEETSLEYANAYITFFLQKII